MLRKFIEIDLIDDDGEFYDTRYTSFDSIGNDYPDYIILNVDGISIAKEVWGYSEFNRKDVEFLDSEARDEYYKHLFTKVDMDNGFTIYIQETLDELVAIK